jgi:hypothetical protein
VKRRREGEGQSVGLVFNAKCLEFAFEALRITRLSEVHAECFRGEREAQGMMIDNKAGRQQVLSTLEETIKVRKAAAKATSKLHSKAQATGNGGKVVAKRCGRRAVARLH